MPSKAQFSGSRTQSAEQSWRPRDFVAAAALFLGSAAFVLWQNTRVAVLWDLGYLLDTSWRIALGQMPYRDFPLVHAPLTFLIQASLMRIFGRHYMLPVVYAALASGAGSLVTWRILLHILRKGAGLSGNLWRNSLVLSAPLAFVGIYAIYPHPIYDCDCALSILVAALLLVRLDSAAAETGRAKTWLAVTAGAACLLPVLFKQNMGLPFLLAALAAILALLAAEGLRTGSVRAAITSPYLLVLAGMALALLAALALVAATAGLGNYWYWTVQFAAQRRLPGMAAMLSVYQQPSFAWTLPSLGAGLVLCHTRLVRRVWGQLAAFALISAPLIASLIFLFLDDDADERADNLLSLWPLWLIATLVLALFRLRKGISLGALMPLIVLAAIHGAFLSQQLWGSTYALWPLLLVLIAQAFAMLPASARPAAIASAGAVSMTFLVCGGLYAASLERLSYILMPGAHLEWSTEPALRGMAALGPYVGNLDELIDFAGREVPLGEALLVIPGEDPFYFATGRRPQFPVLLFDPTTDPYTPAKLLDEARHRGVRWAIVKRVLQLNSDPVPQSAATLQLISREFTLRFRLKGYDIYRRR